jgi:4-aminobutyrate aminotransferase/(S)-3-amino-2-methylpropionate transaminase
LTGRDLARLVTAVPGPRSRALASRLARVESRNVTALGEDGPIFWADAAGANVRDVDDNVYIDLTAGFGVANAGHANAAVSAAIADQARRLPHALGDVHPAEPKVQLLEALDRITPASLSVTILGSAGAEAVEAALKTALLHTGRPGVIAFEHAYHGLTYGALATTWRSHFRSPFTSQLTGNVRFAPYPARTGDAAADNAAEDAAIDAISRILVQAEDAEPVGAILVEPIQGRGGIVVPTDGFLPSLRALCDGERLVLIFDEIYTGMGRTGRWFAAEHWNVVPDIICAGKALTGSVPLSATIGTPAVMAAWPPSSGEAMHTSTFLGNPVACAAGLAQIAEIDRLGLLDRARQLGERIAHRTARWVAAHATVRSARGIGLLQGVVLEPGHAVRIAIAAQREGVLVLAEGDDAEVLAITPPAVISDAQLERALDVIETALEP